MLYELPVQESTTTYTRFAFPAPDLFISKSIRFYSEDDFATLTFYFADADGLPITTEETLTSFSLPNGDPGKFAIGLMEEKFPGILHSIYIKTDTTVNLFVNYVGDR